MSQIFRPGITLEGLNDTEEFGFTVKLPNGDEFMVEHVYDPTTRDYKGAYPTRPSARRAMLAYVNTLNAAVKTNARMPEIIDIPKFLNFDGELVRLTTGDEE